MNGWKACLIAFGGVCLALSGACRASHRRSPAVAGSEPPALRIAPTVTIQPPVPDQPFSPPAAAPRLALRYDVVASAPLEQPADMPRRQAAIQAAAVLALASAVAEDRAVHGLDPLQFSVKLNDTWTLTRETSTDAGNRAERILLLQSADAHDSPAAASSDRARIETVDGRLTHPPVEWQVIEDLFRRTAGQYRLLSTRFTPSGDQAVAVVGCYDAAAGPMAATDVQP